MSHYMTTDNKGMDVARLCVHLKKRLLKEYGVEITPEWEQRVLDGTHDVPLPDPKTYGPRFQDIDPAAGIARYFLARWRDQQLGLKMPESDPLLQPGVDPGKIRALTHKNCGGAIAQVPADEEKPYEYEQEDGTFAYIPVMRCLKCRHEIGGNADIAEFTPQREIPQVPVAKLDTPKDPELRPASKYTIKNGDHVACAGDYFGTVESDVYPDGKVLIRINDTNELIVSVAAQWRPILAALKERNNAKE